MTDRQKLDHPFSYYDFFGYLFPGLLLAVYIYWFCSILCVGPPNPKTCDGPQSLTALTELIYKTLFQSENPNLFSSGIVLVLAVVLCYVFGHIVAAAGSIAFDRVLVNGVLEYPVTHLLKLEYSRDSISRDSYKITIQFLFLFMAAPWLFRSSDAWRDKIYFWSSICVISLIGLRMLTTLLRELFHKTKDFVKNKYPTSPPPRFYYQICKLLRSIRAFCIRPVVMLLAFPATAVMVVLRRLFRLEGFSDDFVDKYEKCFYSDFHISSKSCRTENHWLPLWTIYLKSATGAAVIRNWINLYAFARNVAAVSFLACGYANWWMWYHPKVWNEGVYFFIKLSLCVGVICTVRYWQLYFTYYSKNTIRAYYLISLMHSKEGPQQGDAEPPDKHCGS